MNKSDTVLKKEGFKILLDKLGLVDMERFIALINREKLDYTKWRKDLFEDMSIDELSTKADEFSNKLSNEKK